MMKPTPQKREAIRKACIAANPEIVELKLGCLIRPKNEEGLVNLYKFEWGDEKGEHDHFPLEVIHYTPDSETYEERELIEGELVVGFFDPFEGYVVRQDTRDWLAMDDMKEDVEILGRPIRLADVLLTGADGFGAKNVLDLTIYWNLRKDSLEDQSEETIDFIYQLLANQ